VIVCEGSRCHIAGAVTMDSVGGLLRELQPQLERGMDTLDFSRVELADSAALTLIFSAMRHARQAGHGFVCTGLPASFTTLAELYGVSALLPA
jgi:phospholipid transport system transporter-binding protein